MTVDFFCNIAWCFNDLFIICISILLEKNFSLFNSRILLNTKVREKGGCSKGWKNIKIKKFIVRNHLEKFVKN
jgi:hypothetical protein